MTYRARLAIAIMAVTALGVIPNAIATAAPAGYLFYRVRAGDTLAAVARRYEADVATIARLSGVAHPDRLAISTVLKIPLTVPVAGAGGPRPATTAASGDVTTLYTVKRGDTLLAIATRFGTTALHLAAVNGLPDPDRLQVGQRLVVSGGGATPVPVAWRLLPTPHFQWPVHGYVSSPFGPRWGRMHEGVDIAAPYGSPVVAAAPGIVVRAGWESGYGRVAVVHHSFGLETRYAHASRLLVHAGEIVAAGQRIALVGASGDATGPHVHFEVRFMNTPEDPLPLLPADANATATR